MLSKQAVKLAANSSQHDNFYSTNASGTLLDAVGLFGQGVHRVNVLDDQGNFSGVVSQSDALALLAKHAMDEALAPLMNAPISQLGLCSPREVLTVPEGTAVIDAIKLLCDSGLTSLPVVDRRGMLLSVVSTTDIKYLFQSDELGLLHQDVHKFATETRRLQQAEMKFKATVPVFGCSPDMALGAVVGRLAATRAHRLWLHNAEGQLQGVITLSDVLRLLTPAPHKPKWMIDFRVAHN